MRGVVAATAASVLLALAPGHATQEATGEYTIGTLPVVSVVCSPDCLGEPGLNLGGYIFEAVGEAPTSISIADDSGAPVSFTVCQDFNQALCGEEGEPFVELCATEADLSGSEVPFAPDQPTSVFVRLAAPDCVGPALGGTITMRFGEEPPPEDPPTEDPPIEQ